MKDVELLDLDNVISEARFPLKMDKVTQVIVAEGEISCIVDFYSYSLKAPAVALFLPGQIIESIEVNEHFKGYGMAVTKEFTDSLNLPVSFQEKLFLKNNHFYTLNNEGLESLMACYAHVASIMKQNAAASSAVTLLFLYSTLISVL